MSGISAAFAKLPSSACAGWANGQAEVTDGGCEQRLLSALKDGKRHYYLLFCLLFHLPPSDCMAEEGTIAPVPITCLPSLLQYLCCSAFPLLL